MPKTPCSPSLSEIRKDMEGYFASRSDAEFNESDHPREEDGKFGSGGSHYGSSLGYEKKEIFPGSKNEYTNGDTNIVEDILPSGKKMYLTNKSAGGFDTFEEAHKAGVKESKRNTSFDDIPSTWKGDSKSAAKELIKAGYTNLKYNQSTQSKSKYITIVGENTEIKLRISDHHMSKNYEDPDVNHMMGGGKTVKESVNDAIAMLKERDRESRTNSAGLAEDPKNELDIARAIQSGELASPQHYENIWLFDVRITGTGTSYRQALKEYVYRPPEKFLTDDFLARCNGLALIFGHPDHSILDTEEFRERSIGNVILPYIKGDEVWGIAKVYDDDAAQAMQTTHTSTSPAVVFRHAGSTESFQIDDGKSIFIEGVPSYLDHLAICGVGVWDKGGNPAGINLTEGATIMPDQVPAWADALMKRMDSMEDKGRKDSEEELKADKARKDSEEEEAKKKADSEKSEEELKAEEARKDSEEKQKESEEKMDAAIKSNAELKAQIASMQASMAVLTQPLSSDDRDLLSAAQSRADGVAQMFGNSASAPLHGETPINYRKRLAAKLQKHSKDFAGIKLDSLDGAVFDQVESKIYADAQAHAMSPAVAVAGRLIPQVRADSAGRQITTYTGDMDAWMGMFKSKPVYITGFNREGNK